jgi:ribosome-associated toxin RatA of RatAB toxin-antitoxin module
MTIINRSALLPYSADQLFELVSDVKSYPQFMDGCVGVNILRREENLLEARLELARAGISQSFSTRNRMLGAREIKLELIEGPFEYFTGRWEFRALGESACKMSLNLEFTFKNTLICAAASRLFDSATNSLVEAVCRRASQLYG